MIVTLCGSVRFEEDFHEANLELARRGITCYSLVVWPSQGTDASERGAALDGNYDKLMLDLGYLRKIAVSDAILVLGDGYIGQSTAREILWAHMNGKRLVSQADPVGRLDWPEIECQLRGIDEVTCRGVAYRLVQSACRVFGVTE